MADEQQPDYSGLPLTERFTHKVWKVRKEAYEEAAQIFEKTASEDDPAFRPFLQDSGLWKAAVADSNVAAHQEALAALCAFLKYGGRENGTRTRGNTVATIVEKGLGSTRPAAKASALEALLLYVELDAAGPVIEEMLPALSHKQPKVIAACLGSITAMIHNYGCKIVDPKPVLKLLPKAFGHADKNVRAEATNLTVELYRWLREAIKPMFWGDLKPTQQTDLEAQFEKVKGEPTPKQERLLRKQQEAMARAPAEGEDEEDDGDDDVEEPVAIDAFDLAEPKDVLKEIPDNFYELLGSSKWKERKEAAEALFVIINVPRIKDGDYHELNRGLAKCMKDANVAVVTQAALCIEALAKGLRRSYAKYRATVMQPILERLKEKKATVSDALGLALDAVFQSTSLTDCLEDITAFLVHKNPQIKEGTMKFLARCLRTTRDVPAKNEIASMVESAKKLLSESVETLRSGGAEILGTIMKIIGERAMKAHLDGLDDIRKNKIKECFDTVEVKAKEKPKPAPKAAAPPPAAKKPAARKAAPGAKKSAAAAPAANSAPPPSAKGPPSKLGMSRPGAIKAPGKRSAVASPKLPPASSPSPTFDDDDEPPALAPPQSRSGMGRGLTGRSLAKPAAHAQPAPPPSPPPSSGFTAIERAELEELRTANDHLLRQIDNMRQDRSKLLSEIQELKNQNAGLIEDHTRDVLSIKAKETQLVRARSDTEASEQTNERLRREMDRLKRALSRAEGLDLHNRPGSGMDSPVRVTSPSIEEPGNFRNSRYGDLAAANRNRMSFASNMSEDRDTLDPSMAHQSRVSPDPRYRPTGVSSNSSGRASPAQGYRSAPPRYHDDVQSSYGDERKSSIESGTHAHLGSNGMNSSSAQSGLGANGGVESWKRAAEVTSQLKARIEQMKAKQGIARP